MKFISDFLQIYREVSSIRSFFKINKNNREVVFYSEDKGSYTYFEGLIDYLTNEAGKDVYYATSDENDPLFNLKNKRIHPFYVKKLLSLFTGLCDSKVLIMTMPDLDTFHVKRSKYNINHLYMFHNIGSSFPVIRFGALFNYDTIFCAGPHHVAEIRKQEELYGLQKKELAEFGYFRLEDTYERYRQSQKKERTRCQWKARLLIGPSWGSESIFNVCGMELIEVLLKEGYEVVARPHPMTNIHEPHIMENINKKYCDYPNYSYESDISLYESLFNSDVLITDWSGLFYEYAFGTERPVLFLDVPQKIVNKRYREVGIEPIDIGLRKEIGEVLHPNHLSEIPGVIDQLICEKEKYRDGIIKARDKYIYNLGNSSKVGAEYIIAYCNEKE
jgi:YidC/Oxa1 family membrane protein insertase